MKLKLIITAAIALAISAGAFAKGSTSTSTMAEKSLLSEFKDAKNINWSKKANLLEASFNWNGLQLHTFYNEAGDQVALSREITMDKLPLKAIQTIQAKYDGYKATEAIELTSMENGLSYYVSLENGNKKVILNISSEGFVSVFK